MIVLKRFWKIYLRGVKNTLAFQMINRYCLKSRTKRTFSSEKLLDPNAVPTALGGHRFLTLSMKGTGSLMSSSIELTSHFTTSSVNQEKMLNTKPETEKNPVHLLIIPYPAPSHMTPLLELTRRLLTHSDNHLIATILTTPSTLPLLQPLLSTFPPSWLQHLILSPPPSPLSYGVDDPPPPPPICRMRALDTLSDPVISWFKSHLSPPHVIISDFLCFWTYKLSSTLCVPRVVFYSPGAFGSAVMYATWRLAPSNPREDPDLEVVLDDLDGSPRIKWRELSGSYQGGKPGIPYWDTFRGDLLSNLDSWGAIFNTFSELEKVYVDHFKNEMGHNRVWAVGPVLQDDLDQSVDPCFQEVMTWLDGKPDCSVAYVCFGSRTTLTREKSATLKAALELSKIHFVWCISESGGDTEFDMKTNEAGFIIEGWAPQVGILKHRAVGGFVTHCGWNSIIESIWSGVVMVAWPMGADQYSNAQLVVDQLGLGFRVKCNDSKNVPDPHDLAQLLIESVSETRLERGRVTSLRKVATSTVESGISATDFEQFVKCLTECNI